MNPGAHLCFYGLYAPVNESYLRGLGVETILGGEFEEGLRSLAERLGAGNRGGGEKMDRVNPSARIRASGRASDFGCAAKVCYAGSQRDGGAR